MLHTIFDEELADPGAAGELCDGLEQVERLAAEFKPEAMAAACGIEAAEIRRMARELAGAESAAVYGRIGTTTQEFGTITSWLVDVLNIVTGNLDREGGAMFPLGAAGQKNASGTGGSGKGVRFGRWRSRVGSHPETYGELPGVVLAEEIDTEGEGRVRALITAAGNPLRSTPNSERLERAVESLDFVLSVDIYLNETTRHADVILPAPDPLSKSHFDLAFGQLAVRNVANYSPPVFEANGSSMPHEWETLLRLAGVLAGQGPDSDIAALDELVVRTLIGREVATEGSNIAGRDADEVFAELEGRRGPERVLDFMLRSGPYGDGFGADPDGLTLDVLERNPHGVDFGPLKPRLPEVLRTPTGKIELAPGEIVADLDRLRASLARGNGHLVLIGRRQLRSNNSWMHNLEPLVKGKERCTMHVHPEDADRLSLVDGAQARLSLACGRDRGAGRGDRRDHARRRLDPPRLGPRRSRRADGRRRRPRRGQLERARRRGGDGPVERKCRPQRHSGRSRRGLDLAQHRRAAVRASHVRRIAHARDRRVGAAVGAIGSQLPAAQAVDAAVASSEVRPAQPRLLAARALRPEVDHRVIALRHSELASLSYAKPGRS